MFLQARAVFSLEEKERYAEDYVREACEAGFSTEHRQAALAQMIASAKLRRDLLLGRVATEPPQVNCPPPGSGVRNWSTAVEDHHWYRHAGWADQSTGFCHSMGLWTGGCGVMCPLRAVAIGIATGLQPGETVLDIGSGCGHFALWYHQWFGARVLGLDFAEAGVRFAQEEVTPKVPSQFCWLDIASHRLDFIPARSVDLATAVSVLHYLRTDSERWEAGEEPVPGEGPKEVPRTSCLNLRLTVRTQCRVAREMFRTVRVGGHVWVSHNGCYNGKWDPKRVWGPDYWECCFYHELRLGRAHLAEIPELELFLHQEDWHTTYSLVVRRLA